MSTRDKKAISVYFTPAYGMPSIIRHSIFYLISITTSLTEPMILVFLRKNFGERYFSFSVGGVFTSLLMLVPMVFFQIASDLSPLFKQVNLFTYLLFIIVYLGFSLKRRMEMKIDPHVVNCDKLSYYDGDINHDIWNKISQTLPFNIKTNRYTIDKIYEPILTMVVGIILSLTFVFTFTGVVIFLIGLGQLVRGRVQYYIGRDSIVSQVDEIIAGEDMRDVLINETKSEYVDLPVPNNVQFKEQIIENSRNFSYEDSIIAR